MSDDSNTADRLPVAPEFVQRAVQRADESAAASVPGREPTMLEQMTARTRLPTGEERTPIERARDDYNQLRTDNMILIDEVRALTIERDVLQAQLTEERKDKHRIQVKYEECAKRLGSIMQNMRTAGDSILQVIRASQEAVSDEPGLTDFAPSGLTAGKIQTR